MLREGREESRRKGQRGEKEERGQKMRRGIRRKVDARGLARTSG